MAQKQDKKIGKVAKVEEQGYPAAKSSAAAPAAKSSAAAPAAATKAAAPAAATKAAVKAAAASASASSASSSQMPAAALLASKPVRKSRTAAKTTKVTMSSAQRAWLKEEASTVEAFLWDQKISNLKRLMTTFDLSSEGVDTKDAAVALLWGHMREEDVEIALITDDAEGPEEDVSEDTSEEEPKDPAEQEEATSEKDA